LIHLLIQLTTAITACGERFGRRPSARDNRFIVRMNILRTPGFSRVYVDNLTSRRSEGSELLKQFTLRLDMRRAHE
jgi:hypothetical protein